MAKFNIFFMLRGTNEKEIEVPNKQNPVECEDIHRVVDILANNWPEMRFGVEIVGVRAEKVKE